VAGQSRDGKRLAINHVVLDKTGTLTLGDPVVRGPYDSARLQAAAMLARASHHPFSRAIARAAGVGPVADDVREQPGPGVFGRIDGQPARLGSAAFVAAAASGGSALWFAFEGEAPQASHFDDRLRDDAADVVQRLKAVGLEVDLLSGDTDERVAQAAAAARITRWTCSATPQSKAERLRALEAAGRKVLMVGDGLNDAGAIAGTHVSIVPGGAVDVSRLAADCVFSGEGLGAIVRVVEIARTARSRMREDFAFAALYNVVAVPVALAGWATPLVAAIAMSASSAVVTLNALRLAGSRDRSKAQ
jgi:Cu2+-exporting ATPase